MTKTNEITSTSMEKFFRTSVGNEILQKVNTNIISAAKYYMGVPDGKFFDTEHFGSEVAEAKKAYITLNTLMGVDSSERDRFSEGKKQIHGLLTVPAVRRMVELYTYLYLFAVQTSEDITYETVRACRQSEISEGESTVRALASTTKLSIDEIMKFGYGNKNGLAICRYKFHKGAVVFDMEKLNEHYLKPEEREVLILMGNKLVSRCLGYDERYTGKDGKPAMIYEIDVYPPEPLNEPVNLTTLEAAVYNKATLKPIRTFYFGLNVCSDFPKVPECYPVWKANFQKLVLHQVSQLI